MRDDVFPTKRLGDVLLFRNGKSVTPGGIGKYPVFGSNGLIGRNDKHTDENAIILGRVGAHCGSIIYCQSKFWASDNTIVAYPKTAKYDVRFLSYLLRELKLNRWAGGAAQPLLTQTVLKQVEARIPDLSTQQKIASMLSAYDDLIENNLRRIKILEEMARAIYQEWFVYFRFPGHENIRMINSSIGPVPEGWSVMKVTEAVSVNPQTVVPKQGKKPFVPMSSLANDSMLIEGIQYRAGNNGSKFRNGDTLFARITPCLENGKTGFVQFLQSEHGTAFGSTEFIVLRTKSLCPEYVYLMARSDAFRDHAIKSMSGATGRQRVQEACFERFLIAHPDKQTTEAFHATVSPIFKSLHLLACKNATLRQTRDLLLPKLISGEVDVSELNINEGNAVI